MRTPAFFCFVVLAIIASTFSGLPACAQSAETPAMNDAEKAFAKAMTGAKLVGHFTVGQFTVDDSPRDKAPPLHTELYELGEVAKLPNGQWRLQTRIRYGDKDITLPIMVPIEWVGADGPDPTPVVVIDRLFFPGAGTYSARVLFHDGQYAGRWAGESHGGVLFGTVVPADAPATAE